MGASEGGVGQEGCAEDGYAWEGHARGETLFLRSWVDEA